MIILLQREWFYTHQIKKCYLHHLCVASIVHTVWKQLWLIVASCFIWKGMDFDFIEKKKTTQPTYEGKLNHLLEGDEGSVFCLHAGPTPVRPLGRYIQHIAIVVAIVVVIVVVIVEVDAELVDEAVVDVVRFALVAARKRHVIEQISRRCFLLQKEKDWLKSW